MLEVVTLVLCLEDAEGSSGTFCNGPVEDSSRGDLRPSLYGEDLRGKRSVFGVVSLSSTLSSARLLPI